MGSSIKDVRKWGEGGSGLFSKVYIGQRGEAGRGSEISKILRTSFMDDPYGTTRCQMKDMDIVSPQVVPHNPVLAMWLEYSDSMK